MRKRVPLLVLGLGNVLCGDDGLGVIAVQRLAQRYAAPPGVQILDGGTLGLSLLPYLEDAQDALLIDAVRADAPPGSLVRLQGDAVAAAVAARLSPHQIGVADLLHAAAWRGRLPERLLLLGAVPDSIELRLGLSPVVERQLPGLIEQSVATIAELGFSLVAHAHGESADRWAFGDGVGGARL